jgi:hypothetical protein
LSLDLARAPAPLDLVVKDEDTPLAWACGSCRTVYMMRKAAYECCSPAICDDCKLPFQPAPKFASSICKPCLKKAWDAGEFRGLRHG